MLEFYATSGDFTRRLTDIRANSKFSSPLSGPEDLFSVCAALHAWPAWCMLCLPLALDWSPPDPQASVVVAMLMYINSLSLLSAIVLSTSNKQKTLAWL